MQSFIALCLLLYVGHLLRMKVRLVQKLYLPSSVIAGLLGLLVLQVAQRAGAPVPAVWTLNWGMLPGRLINIVFACLFLGVALPPLRRIVKSAGPQLAYGQIVAWGQYVVGIGLFLVAIRYLAPQLPAMFGAIIPIGFEGGHGTAAGMAATFDSLNWPQGKDFALASATAGIVSAIVVGMALINWAVRRGHTAADIETVKLRVGNAVIPEDQRPAAGKLTVSSDAIETLTLQLVIVGMGCAIGWLVQQGLIVGANLTGSDTAIKIGKSFPLFPLCMLGGLVIQILAQRYDRNKLIDRGLVRRLQNIALDFLVVAAIATIRIESLRGAWLPFTIIVVAGILWNVFCVVVLAPRLLPDAWFERAIAEMGQSMGVTATGLLLLRVVDPNYETPAADAFASKQLLHEPFMGGGLWTSAAVPLLAMYGGFRIFLITVGAVAFWFVAIAVARAVGKGKAPG